MLKVRWLKDEVAGGDEKKNDEKNYKGTKE